MGIQLMIIERQQFGQPMASPFGNTGDLLRIDPFVWPPQSGADGAPSAGSCEQLVESGIGEARHLERHHAFIEELQYPPLDIKGPVKVGVHEVPPPLRTHRTQACHIGIRATGHAGTEARCQEMSRYEYRKSPDTPAHRIIPVRIPTGDGTCGAGDGAVSHQKR